MTARSSLGILSENGPDQPCVELFTVDSDSRAVACGRPECVEDQANANCLEILVEILAESSSAKAWEDSSVILSTLHKACLESLASPPTPIPPVQPNGAPRKGNGRPHSKELSGKPVDLKSQTAKKTQTCKKLILTPLKLGGCGPSDLLQCQHYIPCWTLSDQGPYPSNIPSPCCLEQFPWSCQLSFCEAVWLIRCYDLGPPPTSWGQMTGWTLQSMIICHHTSRWGFTCALKGEKTFQISVL